MSDVFLWDVASGRRVWAFGGEFGEVNALAFAPDGKTLLYCDLESVGLIDAATGRLARVVRRTTRTPRR